MYWIIGDLHYQVANSGDTSILEERLVRLLETSEEPVEGIFCMGDQLHRHENIHVDPFKRITDFLFILSKLAPLYILVGNHDRPNNSNFLTTDHPFNALKHWPNTHVIDEVRVFDFGSHHAIMVPYVYKGRFQEALQTKVSLEDLQTPGQYAFILAHQEFMGCRMGSVRSEDGDIWPLDYPYVISGHIHDYEQLQANILYVGTPYQLTFADSVDKTISTMKVTSEGLKFDRINLDLPKKLLLYMSCQQVLIYQPETNADTRIVVSGTDSELKTMKNHPAVKKLKASGIKIKEKCLPNFYSHKDEAEALNKIRLTYTERLYEAAAREGFLDVLQRIIQPPEDSPPEPLPSAAAPAPPAAKVLRKGLKVKATGSSEEPTTSPEESKPKAPRKPKSPTEEAKPKAPRKPKSPTEEGKPKAPRKPKSPKSPTEEVKPKAPRKLRLPKAEANPPTSSDHPPVDPPVVKTRLRMVKK